MPLDLRLRGLASALPHREVSNAEVGARVGLPAEEVLRRTGVRTRFYAEPGQGPSALAAPSARVALDEAGVAIEDVSMIVFATMTPDVTFPGAACYLQERLGATTVGALDVRGQSAGFLCALDLALGFAQDPRYRHVLIAAAEVFSSGLDQSPRGAEMTPRFGDGAAVGVVSRPDDASSAGRGIQVASLHWETDGTLAEDFWCEYPASKQFPTRLTVENLRAGLHYPRGDLVRLAPVVVERLAAAIRRACREAGFEPGSVDAGLVDWVDPAVAQAAGRAAGIPEGRIRVPTAEFGHLGAAGLPVMLDRTRRELGEGARVIAAAAGSGLTLGAAALLL